MPPPMAKRATKTSTGMKIIRRIMIAHSFGFFVHISLLIPAGVDLSARFAYIHRVADESTVRAMKSGPANCIRRRPARLLFRLLPLRLRQWLRAARTAERSLPAFSVCLAGRAWQRRRGRRRRALAERRREWRAYSSAAAPAQRSIAERPSSRLSGWLRRSSGRLAGEAAAAPAKRSA